MLLSICCHADPPSFVRRPHNIQADSQENITLVCIVDANPTPDIIWVFDPIDRVSRKFLWPDIKLNWPRRNVSLSESETEVLRKKKNNIKSLTLESNNNCNQISLYR